MLIAMCLHQEETGLAQVTHIIDFYNAISDRKLSLPTPIMAVYVLLRASSPVV
ncbi:aerobic ribonucleotide reductase large subunit [Klebsiella phage CPRSB]|nr:aerobic ribonucleotide reductase large subunit [Klebsiella phage CPRSB]